MVEAQTRQCIRVYAYKEPMLQSLYRSLFFLLITCTACAQSVGDRFTTKTSIEYTRGASGPLRADAYIPVGKGPFPAILFIHGGGWLNGDRSQMVKLIKALANEGYVGFTIDYDVDPIHFPASLQESLAALQYMRSHAKELHIEASRIAVAGSSAGGELAALVALTPGDTPPVQAAVILNGVLDLESLGDGSKMVTDYLGGPCTKLPAACKAASPMAQVHQGAPPFYVGHGTADAVVPYPQAEAFVSSLRAAHVEVHPFVAEGGPHTYWIREKFFAQNLAEIKGFLAQVLAPK